MFDLPGLDGVEEVVINREVAEGRAKPLYLYGKERARRQRLSAASRDWSAGAVTEFQGLAAWSRHADIRVVHPSADCNRAGISAGVRLHDSAGEAARACWRAGCVPTVLKEVNR